jgi:competence protein ComEC
MKFPALALAAFLALGIVADRFIATGFPQAAFLFVVASALSIVLGLVLAMCRRSTLAWIAALLAWSALGAAAARLEQLDIPADHVTGLLAQNALNLDQPLRWQGTLRSDPLELPWGLRYQLDLEAVQSSGLWMPVSGGLRADYYFADDSSPEMSALRAGDRVEILARAHAVRNFGNPGSFDYRVFLARQNIDLTATLRNAQLVEKLAGPPPTLAHWLARLRGRLLRQTDRMFAASDDRAAVVRAMLLGDRSFLDTEQVDAFRQTGAYHILVLSGLQVGVLAAILLWTTRRVRLPMLAGIAVTIAALWAYAGIVEDQPPIARAAWMATAYLLAFAFFRRTHVLNALGLAALVILAARPSEISDASFLLSFLAVATIGGIAAPWLERTAGIYLRALDHLGDVTRDASHPPRAAQFRLDLRAAAGWLASHLPTSLSGTTRAIVAAPCRLGLWLWETIVISAAIQLTMLPLMAQYFHRVSVLGLAANVPAVLLTGAIVPLGFLSLGAGALWQPLGRLLGRILAPAVGALLWSVQVVSRLPQSSYRVPSPPVAALVAFFAATTFFAAMILLARRWAAVASGIVVTALAALIAIYPFAPRLDSQHLEITVLDVGQGDSLFVAFPDGKTMLVDGGGLPGSAYIRSRRPGIDVGEDVVSPFLWTRGLKRLDVVALTHAHQDHLAGLAAILLNFRVGELWVGRDIQSPAYNALLAEARERGIPIVHRKRGDQFDWDGVHMQVLWPGSLEPAKTAENDDSLVLRLETGQETLLLTGDIERPVERTLGADGDALSADFLKVPHHGSRTSTTEPFLDAVHPRFAAISVGENNPFGHPSEDVLQRIEAEGARLYRTDRDGAITILADGNRMAVHTFLTGD